MEESFKTGQVSNIGGQHNAPANRYYSPKKKAPKPQFNKLRHGEIVQGRIIKITGYQTALVHLPIGNFQAEIHGKLLPGDELFLLVAETSPNLVLKVHSVTIIKNKVQRDVKEIIRILDLSEKNEFIEAVIAAKAFENTIVRDEILSIIKQYSTLPRNEISNFNSNVIMEQLWKFKSAGIDFDRVLFISTLPYALGLNEISNDFKILSERTNLIVDLTDTGDTFNKSSIQKYFRDWNNTIELISNNLNDSSVTINRNDEILTNALKNIMDFFHSMFIQNTIFFHKNYIFEFITPFIYKNQLHVFAFTFRMKNMNLHAKSKLRSKIDSSGYFNVYEYLNEIIQSQTTEKYDSKTYDDLSDDLQSFVNQIVSLPIIIEKILLLKDEVSKVIYSGNIQSSIIKSISVVL
jgi:hypothetical protein